MRCCPGCTTCIRCDPYSLYFLMGLQGLCGQVPDARHLLRSLQESSLFVYMGHGSGEHYLPSAATVRKSGLSGASLLMGCSSGKLRQQGLYPPSGALTTYLLSGKYQHVMLLLVLAALLYRCFNYSCTVMFQQGSSN